jgi:hypothetical protein
MSQESRATAAGIAAMMTPAASAELCVMPKSMQIENKKLPKKDSRKSSPCVRRSSGASSDGLCSHSAMATAAMAKRSHARMKTGKTITRAFEKPT